jgi:hypothetical protein
MRKFTIVLILSLAQVACAISAASVNKNPSYEQIDAKVFAQSQTHPNPGAERVIVPDVSGTRARP